MIKYIEITELGNNRRCTIVRDGYEPNSLGHTMRNHEYNLRFSSAKRLMSALRSRDHTTILGGILLYKMINKEKGG